MLPSEQGSSQLIHDRRVERGTLRGTRDGAHSRHGRGTPAAPSLRRAFQSPDRPQAAAIVVRSLKVAANGNGLGVRSLKAAADDAMGQSACAKDGAQKKKSAPRGKPAMRTLPPPGDSCLGRDGSGHDSPSPSVKLNPSCRSWALVTSDSVPQRRSQRRGRPPRRAIQCCTRRSLPAAPRMIVSKQSPG